MPDTNSLTAGINASKSTLDVAIHGRAEISRVPNTAVGWKALAATFPGAHHWNKALMGLHERMRARGASHTCAIVACARKLLVQVNAVVARGTLWEERPIVAA